MRNKIKRILAAVMAAGMTLSVIPSITTYAAQSNEYVDPADVWIEANGRTSEFDINATVTTGTMFCPVCDMPTSNISYRVPEYTRTGETAYNRGVYYSDGTLIDGKGKGNLDDGTPGVDAFYTGYHWTKSVCQNCGTVNSVDGINAYSCGKDVYSLNPCDSNFFLDFDSTEYIPYNSRTHTVKAKKGKYCQFCKGTKERVQDKQENHNFTENVNGELGNQRFHITADCEDCGYKKNEYAAAKSVVQSYYGKVDGKPHTVTVNDLSENGVNTSIRYGTEAKKCNKTSAPNYTDEGYYPVYYEIEYTYGGESMTENGVSYVWLLSDNPPSNTNSIHTHDFRFLETVRPTCTELGFDRFQCAECGALQKTNYTPASGHDYNTVVIREPSCQQGGLELHSCTKCGSYYTESTSMTGHRYETNIVASTCTKNGYTEHICIDCGYKYITDLTPLAKHDYRPTVTAPTCKTKGFTTYKCRNCDDTYVGDYTEPRGHKWDEGHTVTNLTCESEGVMEYHCKHCDEKMIQAISATGHTPGKAATCTEPQKCESCGAILELPTGHTYSETVTEPTCTAMGFTTYNCENCDHSYIGNYTDKTEHKCNSVVTPPTCTEMGYTTYTCEDCGDSYISDYTDKTEHKYNAVVTSPTCTEMGYTTYTCEDCGDSYKSDYTEVLPHNYNKQTIKPTCTSQGYTIYTCPDCGKEYIGDEQEPTEHKYIPTVTAPTCTEMGYTTFTCEDCGKSYVADYTDAKGHNYEEKITTSTCTGIGYTTFTCKDCGISYIGNEQAKTAHDYETTVTAPTCTELGYTTYTCKNCGETYRADEVSAKGHKMSDWIIDVPATIENEGSRHIECTDCGTVLKIEEIPQLTDKDNSDEDGYSKVGDYSILITDKDSKPVFNSEISIDKDDNITIKLPEGRLLDYEDRTTITVVRTDTKAAAEGLNINISDKSGNAATGQTDAGGQLIVPNNQSSTGNENGTIGGDNGETKYTYVVTVTDKNDTVIPDCEIHIGDNHDIVVKLPDGTAMNSDNRVTVTVKDQNGEAKENVNVIVIGDSDYIEKGVTNANGQATLPNKNQAYTDKNGTANVNGYIVLVEDETEPVYMALVTVDDNGVMVCLPDGKKIDYHNRTSVIVKTNDGKAVEGVSVNVYDNAGGDRTEITDKDGKITVPPLNENIIENKPTPEPTLTTKPGLETPEPSEKPDATDEPSATDKPSETEKPDATEQPSETEKPKPTVNPDNGSEVVTPDYSYKVSVNDNDGAVNGAIVSVDKDNGSVTVKLPDEKGITPDNRIIIGITDKDGKAVNGVPVTVIAKDGTEAKDLTNSEGIAIVPPTSTDRTDKNGYAQVVEGEKTYNVIVEDTKAKIENAAVEVKDGKISVILPDGNKLNTDNQTTVTVSGKDNTAVKDISVTVTDKDNKTATKSTDANGKITVPVKTSTGGGGGSSSGGSGGSSGYVKPSYTVKVVDKDGKTVNVNKTVKDDKITLTLPSGKTLDDNYYTITVTDNKGKTTAGIDVTLKDKNNSVSGATDANGQLIMPTNTHNSYVVGYEDGAFKPENNMTRAEAAAIFARNIAERKGENISSRKSSFKDVSSKDWFNNYIAYLEKYKVISGYDDKTFKPDEHITRAEFVTMCMRFYALDAKTVAAKKNIFNDVPKSHWASGYIYSAVGMGWINGYSDSTFKPDSNITRAEVVTIVNRVTGRAADTEYINKNMSAVNKFTDLKDKSYWAFYEILEASNTHNTVDGKSGETWVK